VIAELGGTYFDNPEAGSMARTASRAERCGGPISRKPPLLEPRKLNQRPHGDEGRSDPCGELSTLFRFIEDMKSAAIEDELEGTLGRRGDEKIQCRHKRPSAVGED
jgi:hypothetical protein